MSDLGEVPKAEGVPLHPRPGQEEIKPVMYFVGKQKGLILTATNQDFLPATITPTRPPPNTTTERLVIIKPFHVGFGGGAEGGGGCFLSTQSSIASLISQGSPNSRRAEADQGLAVQ